MKEYRALHDTWVFGRPVAAGKTMMLEPDRAKGYVEGGLLIDLDTEAAKAKGEAAKAAKPKDA